jgi:hypothetical protein
MNQVKLGIQIAKAIVQGDYQRAYVLKGQRNTWEVCEARAIIGASKYAQKKFNAPGFQLF